MIFNIQQQQCFNIMKDDKFTRRSELMIIKKDYNSLTSNFIIYLPIPSLPTSIVIQQAIHFLAIYIFFYITLNLNLNLNHIFQHYNSILLCSMQQQHHILLYYFFSYQMLGANSLICLFDNFRTIKNRYQEIEEQLSYLTFETALHQNISQLYILIQNQASLNYHSVHSQNYHPYVYLYLQKMKTNQNQTPQTKQTQKYLILVYGIPASGKSYFSHILKSAFIQNNKQVKLVSVDCIQAFLSDQNKNQQTVEKLKLIISKHQNWQDQLSKYQIKRSKFSAQCWKQSRQFIRSFQVLDIIFKQTDFLIIQDQMLLKSQRKPFKRYCYENKVKFLDFQMELTLEQAVQNNKKRSENHIQEHLNQEVLKNSLQKFQASENSIKVKSQQMSNVVIGLETIYQKSYFVQIQDNYKQQIQKQTHKKQVIENQKELDEKQIRELISEILKNEQLGNQYFQQQIPIKQRAFILAKVKKIYIQKKRKLQFFQILKDVLIQQSEAEK